MIPYAAYKAVHFFGIFLSFVGLAAALARASLVRGEDPLRRRLLAFHGAGVFLVLLGGFGMMSRLQISHTQVFPGWVWLKLGLWTVLGALGSIPARRPSWAVPTLLALPLLGLAAALVALYKPL